MIVEFIIFLFIFALPIQGCNLVTVDLKTELKGEGFHRIFQSKLELSSLKRLIDCRVSYYFQIPKGSFVDTDALNVSLLDHCFLSTPFNTEAPANHISLADHKPIIFQSNTELRKVFVFTDELNFPVHLRYHSPSNHESGRSDPIVFPSPVIYLRCLTNETLTEDESCRTNIEKLACGCKSRPKCEYFRLNYKSRPKLLEARIPIGKLWQANFVVYSTIFFVFGLVIWLILSTHNEDNDKKSN